MKTLEEKLSEIHNLIGEYLNTVNKLRTDFKDNNLPTPQQIMEHIADRNCEPLDAVLQKSRKREFVDARQMMAAVLKFGLRMSQENVGELLGGLDHATIKYSINQVSNNYNTYKDYREMMNQAIEHLFESVEIQQYIKARIVDPSIDRKQAMFRFER